MFVHYIFYLGKNFKSNILKFKITNKNTTTTLLHAEIGNDGTEKQRKDLR